MLDLNRKVIFTHPHKCAGTTVEGLFGWHPSKCKGENKSVCLAQFPKWKHATFDKHLEELNLIGEDALRYLRFLVSETRGIEPFHGISTERLLLSANIKRLTQIKKCLKI